ncbi:hypothetical protein CVT25_014589 [Psilocybe cyanescens]|uniref:Uncharacterized protein n=1 Tax=Psilocybe cyanescens TaxID=93625 RepID=A0A409WU34_PSICY|nr:hypothetical protein CVT25_014589 [Psilocybe cyanescens]
MTTATNTKTSPPTASFVNYSIDYHYLKEQAIDKGESPEDFDEDINSILDELEQCRLPSFTFPQLTKLEIPQTKPRGRSPKKKSLPSIKLITPLHTLHFPSHPLPFDPFLHIQQLSSLQEDFVEWLESSPTSLETFLLTWKLEDMLDPKSEGSSILDARR